MTITLPLDKMSASEKLQAMELLWDSLCHEKKEIDSPFWHGEILAIREKSAASFEDWDKAKSDITTKTKK